MINDYPLAGQVAVVTGGGRGIGREIAQALARAGAKVAVTARSRVQLDETVSLIEGLGLQSAAFVMDVTDLEQVKAGVTTIIEHFGPIDLLVNNAGVGGEGMLPWEVDVDAWWHTIEVNVRGVFLCSHAVLPGMIERQRGRIVNIGSNAGLRPTPMASAYAVSKTALLRLTDSLAVAVREHGVSVFAVSPGLVLTDMTRDVPIFKDLPASEWTPIERVGELCVFLASGQADRLTGRYIHTSEDDVHDMVQRADEIVNDDLHTLRLRRK
jgi:NAD(P)-dependent dehydrogenase (short-subunit alcohol dehydrogenase family)